MTETTILQAALGGLLGLVAGTLYLAALRTNVALYVTGRHWPLGLALHLARVAAIAGLLWLLAQIGAAPLLAAVATFSLARLGAGTLLRKESC